MNNTQTPDNLQVIACYEQLKMTPSEISADLGYELEMVKLILASESKLYKESGAEVTTSNKGDNDTLFSKRDAEQAALAITELAKGAELETVKLRANQFIIDEYKGRNDSNAILNQQFNITMVNEALIRARKQLKMAKSQVGIPIEDSNIVDLPSVKVA